MSFFLKRRVSMWWNYYKFSVLIWLHHRRIERAFKYVATLPRDDAMMIVTRWRWYLTQTTNVDEHLRDAYLDAVSRLEQIVKQRAGE